MPRSVAIGEHFKDFIDHQLASGRYRSAGEVVEAGLRLLEERERRRKQQTDEIRHVIEDGRLAGKASPAEDVFERLETRIKEKLGQERA